jgi:uncharacterized protein (DUF1697 family)
VSTHVVLLRGVNVAGHGRIAMSDLRELVTSLGCTAVASYIQSGNLVLTSTQPSAALADLIEQQVADRLGVRTTAVVLTRDQLTTAITGNPYPDETDPKHLHAVFRRNGFGIDDLAELATAQQKAATKGSRDQATVVGGTLYLRTPDGLGRSELAVLLGRSVTATGTARNWTTVTRLATMLAG